MVNTWLVSLLMCLQVFVLSMVSSISLMIAKVDSLPCWVFMECHCVSWCVPVCGF